MSEEAPPPRFTRSNARAGAGSPLSWMLPLALTALVAVLAWRLYQLGPHDVRDPNAVARPVAPRTDLADDEKATIETFRAASPAVVQVTNLRTSGGFAGANESEVPVGSGSGFVWDPKGYIVTNYHVVRGGDAFVVTFADHSTFDATAVGTDEYHDLAVLKIDPRGKPLPALPIGTSRNLLVGQRVFAIGNPFGLDQTLTKGIISGLNREIRAEIKAELRAADPSRPPLLAPIGGVIQTDAAINPGNSGGPLIDSAGRVIGMNTQIASTSGASAGIGFAIPVDTINRVVPQIIRTGKFLRPGLGIEMFPDYVAVQNGLRGVVISALASNSAAGRAGLRGSKFANGRFVAPGDAIVSVDGQPIERSADLMRVLDSHEIGQEVSVVYVRDGKELSAKVKLVGLE